MKYMTLIAQALFLLFFGFKIMKKKKKEFRARFFTGMKILHLLPALQIFLV